MRKLKLDLDMLRVDSFAADFDVLPGSFLASRSIGGGDCEVRCKGTVRAAQEPTWILTCPHSCDPRCPDPHTLAPTCTCDCSGNCAIPQSGGA